MAERPDDLGLRRLRLDDERMDDNSGITIDYYNYTFNLPNTVKRGKKLPRTVTSDSFPGQLLSAYGGALFTFRISKVLFFSIMWHPHSLFTGLEYHVSWAAALATMEDSGPL
jgi:hypothetical protein